MTLKTIDLSKGSFECGGHVWTISEQISFERFRKLQELVIEFGFSADFRSLFSSLNKAWDYLNKTKLAEASVVIHNAMSGVRKLEEKHDVSLRICALFINRAGEDLADGSDALIEDKIAVWAKELDVLPFFHYATGLCREWISAYRIVTQSISEGAREETTEDPNT